MIRKITLMLLGLFVWILIHRYGRWYMGEATFALLVLGCMGYTARKMWEDQAWIDMPNFYNERRTPVTGWDVIAWIAGGILLEASARFMV